MAFTGVPVVQKIGDDLYRITGVSLDGGDSGTAGLEGTAAGGADPEAVLPGCLWGPYAGEYEAVIELNESMQVLVNPNGDASPPSAIPIRVVKTALDTPQGSRGLITLTNDSTDASSDLEIFVRYH